MRHVRAVLPFLGFALSLGVALVMIPGAAIAADAVTVQLSIRNHTFEPAELHVPEGVPVVIEITNADATAEEFDSDDLKAEKVVAANRQITVRLHPLKPGRYKFAGEYHAATAQGVLVVDAKP